MCTNSGCEELIHLELTILLLFACPIHNRETGYKAATSLDHINL